MDVPAVEVQLFANLARLTQDMAQAKSLVGGSMNEISRMAGLAKTALGAIGVGLSVAGLAAVLKHAVDTQASLVNLAREAGTTAEAMSKFSAPVKAAGGSLEDVASGMFRLSKALIEARDPSSKAAHALTAIGLSAKEFQGLKPDEAFEKLARATAKYADGTEKNAVMQALLSKSGREMAKVFAEIAERGELHAKVTNEQALAAKRLEDQMRTLSASSDKFWREIANLGVPAMNEIIAAFIKAKTEGGFLEGVFAAVGKTMDKIRGDKLVDELARVNAQINDLKGEPDRMRDANSWMPSLLGYSEGDIAKAEADLARVLALRQKITVAMQAASAADAQAMRDAANAPKKPDPKFGGEDKTAASDSLISTLKKELIAISMLTVENKKAAEVEVDIARLKKEHKFIDEDKVRGLAKEIDLQREKNRIMKQAIEDEGAITEAYKANEVEARAKVGNLIEGNKYLALETRLIGASAKDRELAVLALEKELAIRKVLNPELAAQIAKYYDERAAMVATRADREQQLSVWNDIAERGSRLFIDMATAGKGAFDMLKSAAKDFLKEMISIFLRRWILQLGAAATGSSALATQAGQVGQGTAAGALGSWLGTATGFTGFTEGVSMGFQSGVAAQGAVGEQVGVWLANYGWVAGIAAVVVAAMATSNALFSRGWRAEGLPGAFEPGGTAMDPLGAGTVDHLLRSIGFNDRWAGILSGSPIIDRIWGHRARQNDAFGVTGSIGPGGVSGTNWQDWSEQGGWFSSTNRGTETSPFNASQTEFFNSIMASVGATVNAVARLVGGDASSALANYSHPFNLQLNENGTPLTDEQVVKLMSDLFGTVLQEQVAIVFTDAGRSELAAYVTALKGTGEEITAFINELVGVMQGLDAMDILGLSVESLMAWQREGESLGAAFERVGGQWAWFTDNFTTDADKITAAQRFVAASFADLGIAVPDSLAGFNTLVRGIDLSTKAGRDLFDALMLVGPAFLSVSNAASATMDAFDELMGRLRPGYTDALNASTLGSDLDQFRARNPWAAGVSNADLAAGLRTITREDFSHYDATSQRLILSVLGLTSATDLNTTATAQFAAALLPTGSSGPDIDAQNRENAARKAREGLKGWWDSALLNPAITNLSTQQQLEEARKQYEAQLALAKAGDPNAIGGLGNYAQTYLELARKMFQGSGMFNDIFRTVMGATGGVAGISQGEINTRLAGVLPTSGTLMTNQTGEQIIRAILELTSRLDDGIPVDDRGTREATRDVAHEIAMTGRKGAAMAGS